MAEPVLVLAMAGSSRRFGDAGVEIPKWALQVGGVTLLERSLMSVTSLLDAGYGLRVVTRAIGGLAPLLERTLEQTGRVADVVNLPAGPPPGQAADVYTAIDDLPDDAPLVIWNVDTFLCSLPAVEPATNWLLLADLPGDHWSFAELADERVVRTAEKQRIAPHASTGLYGFESMAVYRDAVNRASWQDTYNGELYVAPLYNRLIGDGRVVYGHFVPASDVVGLGTPAEVLAACRTRGWSVPQELGHLAGG